MNRQLLINYVPFTLKPMFLEIRPVEKVDLKDEIIEPMADLMGLNNRLTSCISEKSPEEFTFGA